MENGNAPQSDVDAFWQWFEQETGETADYKTVATWSRAEKEESGLLVLTNASLRFVAMSTENWFASLVRVGKSKPMDRGPQVALTVPRGDLRSAVPEPRPLMKRLFGDSTPAILVAHAQGQERFVLPDAKAALKALAQAAAGA